MKALACVALTAAFTGLIAADAVAQTIEGTARRVGAGTGSSGASSAAAPAGTSSQAPLEATYWKAVAIAGAAVPSLPASREVHLVFQPGGRFSGSDGCNRITGSYTLKGTGVTFGQIAGTQMACPDTADVAARLHSALKGTSHWRIVGSRLELFGATGKPLAVFERGQQAPASGVRRRCKTRCGSSLSSREEMTRR